MDAYGNHFTYSSHEQDNESFPYASNFEEGQNQVFDQRYYEDEHYNGCGQYYEDGGYYEDGMYPYNQQVTCNEDYDQWSEQPNNYREEQWYPYTSSFDDSQPPHDEDSYDHCHSNPQFNGESSNSRHKIDNVIGMMDEILALQEEMSKNLEVIRAQDAKKMEYNQEVHESYKDQIMENSLEMPGQAFKEIEDDEDSTMGDCIHDMFSTPPIEDELESYHEDALEGDDLEPRGFDLHEDVVEDRIHAYSQQIPYGGVYDQGEGPIDSYLRVYDCEVFDHGEECHNPQWEEQYYSIYFENPMWEGDESLHEEHPYDHYPSSPPQGSPQEFGGLVIREDLFDNACEDLDKEQPCKQEEMGWKEDIEILAPKDTIEDLKEGVPMKLEVSVEDPFLFTLPLDKFRSFVPYISRSPERNSYNPFTFKGTSFFKGLMVHLEVHCRLDGRKFKWDLKVD